MQEVWYVLEDGTSVDPSEVAPDEKGVLRHKSGVAVAMRSPGVPRSRGIDNPAAERRKSRDKSKDVKPEEPAVGYKTRDIQAPKTEEKKRNG
jgi:hypothetical protein